VLLALFVFVMPVYAQREASGIAAKEQADTFKDEDARR
jgi:hypothetical protein